MFINRFHYLFAPEDDITGGSGGDVGSEDTQDPKPQGTDYKARANELRNKLRGQSKEMNDLKAEMGQLRAKYEGIDMDQWAKFQKQIEETKAEEEKQLFAEGNLTEIVRRRTAAAIDRKDQDIKALGEARAAAEERAKKTEEALNSVYLERDLIASIEKQDLRLRTGARGNAILSAKQHWRIGENGRHEAYTNEGPIYGESGEAIGMDEYVKEHLLRNNQFLFESGGGANSQGNTSHNQTQDGKRVIKRSDSAARAKYMKEIASGDAIVVD